MRRSIRLLALLTLTAFLLPLESAAAEPFKVTSTANDGAGSLRQAILGANSHPGADTIPLEVSGTIELQDPLQIIFDPVSISGPGAGQLEIRRVGSAAFPVFAFTSSDPSSLSGLTVSNGRALSSGGFTIGGGIRNSEGELTLTGVTVKGSEAVADGDVDRAEGGGIYSEGPLTLRDSFITENIARAEDGTSITLAAGGGVAAFDSLTVERSTISGNEAEATGGSVASAQGGGLLTPDETLIELSTISDNSVNSEDGATQTRAVGGGLTAFEANLTGTTLTGNAATSSGLAFGANLDAFMTVVVRNSIVSSPQGGAESCSGETISGGYNLDADGSCEFEAGSDLNGVAAGLDPVLEDNGGPTPTHALLEGSIAIDRGNSFGASTDQRGLPRPSDFPAISNKEGGDGSDIGAFELQVPPDAAAAPAPILVGTEPGDRTPPQTRIVSGPARVGYERRARFRFSSSEAQSSFRCKLDRKRWTQCRSPHKLKVPPGKHLFKVRAIDRFGNADPTPARFSWRVKPLS
jgi:hypothetical protein